MTSTKTIANLAYQCRQAWRDQGAVGWIELTEADYLWICEEWGRKPTAQEWACAGLYPTSSHCTSEAQ